MFISNKIKLLTLLVVGSFLTACGGGSSSGSSCTGSCSGAALMLQAGVVKGPLTGTRTWTLSDAEGMILADGFSTGDDFLFDIAESGVSLLTNTDADRAPFLLAVSAADASVIDASTSAAPVLEEFRTLITSDMIRAAELAISRNEATMPIILTPLSTLATDLLLEGIAVGGRLALEDSEARDALEAEMDTVSAQVLGAFGFGIANEAGANVFTTPSVFITPSSGAVSADELEKIVALRKANEAFALALQTAADAAGVDDADAMLANVAIAFGDRTISSADDDASPDGQAGIQEFLDAAAMIDDDTVLVTTNGDGSPASNANNAQLFVVQDGNDIISGQYFFQPDNADTADVEDYIPDGDAINFTGDIASRQTAIESGGGSSEIDVLRNVLIVDWNDTNGNDYPDDGEFTQVYGFGLTPPTLVEFGDIASQVLPGSVDDGDFGVTGQAFDEDEENPQAFSETQSNLNDSFNASGVPFNATDIPSDNFTNDSDGDGENNDNDPFPNDSRFTSADIVGEINDSNGDGILNLGDIPVRDTNLDEDPELESRDDIDEDGIPDLIDNCTPFDASDFGSDANSDQTDTDADGFGDTCDAFIEDGDASFADDLDRDGVRTALDNCPLISNGALDSNDLGVGNQLDTDGDGDGDACDRDDDDDGVEDGNSIWVDGEQLAYAGVGGGLDQAPTDNTVVTDEDGDNVDDLGAVPEGEVLAEGVVLNPAFNGAADNCPTVSNANQYNLDQAIVDAAQGVEGALELLATMLNFELDDPRLQTDYVDRAGDVTGDDLGDACDADRDGDGRYVEFAVNDAIRAQLDALPEGYAEESADDNPNPSTTTVEEDLDRDGVRDTGANLAVGDEVDNCPTVPNPLQENFDAAEEAAALGVDVAELRLARANDLDAIITTNIYGVGDACDVDDDNDGLVDQIFVGVDENDLEIFRDAVVGEDDNADPSPTDSTIVFYQDRFSLSQLATPAVTSSMRFGLVAHSDSDARAANNPNDEIDGNEVIASGANHSLSTSKGAGFTGIGVVELNSRGEAGSESQSFVFNRNSQQLMIASLFDCASAICSFGNVDSSQVVGDDSSKDDEANSGLFSGVFESGKSFDTNFNVATTSDLGNGNVALIAGSNVDLLGFGSSYIGNETFKIETVKLDAGDCANEQDVLDGAVCELVDVEEGISLRVLSEQDGSASPTTGVSEIADYGVVTLELSYSTDATNQLVGVTTAVMDADGTDASRFTSRVGDGVLTIQYDEVADNLSLTKPADGSVTLSSSISGDSLRGYSDKTGDVISLVGFTDSADASVSDALTKGYAIRVDSSANDAVSLLKDKTFDLEGLYVTGDVDSLRYADLNRMSLSFEETDEGSGELFAKVSTDPFAVSGAYSDTTLPSVSGANEERLTTTALSRAPVTLTNGTLSRIQFPTNDSRVPGLEIEGFYSSNGLLLRLVNTFAEPGPSVGGGTDILTVTNVIISDWVDADDEDGYPQKEEFSQIYGAATDLTDTYNDGDFVVITDELNNLVVAGNYFSAPLNPETSGNYVVYDDDDTFTGNTSNQEEVTIGGGTSTDILTVTNVIISDWIDTGDIDGYPQKEEFSQIYGAATDLSGTYNDGDFVVITDELNNLVVAGNYFNAPLNPETSGNYVVYDDADTFTGNTSNQEEVTIGGGGGPETEDRGFTEFARTLGALVDLDAINNDPLNPPVAEQPYVDLRIGQGVAFGIPVQDQ